MITFPKPCGFDSRDPIHWLAFGFGSGFSSIAPGTCGTVVAVVLYCLLPDLSLALYAILVLAMTAGGMVICGLTARALGAPDHPGIVWDEICGFFITMLAAPPGWLWLLAGFALFRCFDILKPWPIRQIDRGLGGGVGIMADDIVAGCFAWAVLQLLVFLFGG